MNPPPNRRNPRTRRAGGKGPRRPAEPDKLPEALSVLQLKKNPLVEITPQRSSAPSAPAAGRPCAIPDNAARRRIRAFPFLRVCVGAAVGLAAALAMVHLKHYWFRNVPDGYVFYGFLQGDQEIYTSLARAVLSGPNGFTYAYPWDFSDAHPAIFFQLPIAVLAWTKSALGGEWHAAFDAFRLVGAPVMFGALALLVHTLLPARRWFVPGFCICAFGAGVAWVAALPGWFRNDADGPAFGLYLQSVRAVEDNYHYWFLTVARNVTYSFEVFYHALLYLMVFGLLTRRVALAVGVYTVALLSNPFVGVQLTAICLPVLLADMVAGRRRAAASGFVLALVAFVLFLSYYLLFLPRWEIGAILGPRQREHHTHALEFRDMWLAYGPWLLVAAVSLTRGAFLRKEWRSRAGRLLMIWIIGTLALTQNSRFLDPPVQPMHFTRGNLYLPLVLWGLRYLRFASAGSSLRRTVPLALMALAPVLAADNVLFFAARYVLLPHPGTQMFDRPTDEMFTRLGLGQGRFCLASMTLSRMGVARTGRPGYFADEITTPHYEERKRDLNALVWGGAEAEFQAKYDIGTFVFEKGPDSTRRALEVLTPADYHMSLNNERYVVLERRRGNRP